MILFLGKFVLIKSFISIISISEIIGFIKYDSNFLPNFLLKLSSNVCDKESCNNLYLISGSLNI